MPTKLMARDIMNADVIAVADAMDLRELAKLFLDKGITGAPVVDDGGSLVGVISQTDLIYYSLTRGDELVMDSHFYQNARVEGRHLPAGFQVEDANSGTVADVMTPVVHSVTETTTIESVARLMTRNHIHRVIVRRGRKVTGIISAIDVLDAYAREQGKRPAAKPSARAARPKARGSDGAKGGRGAARSRPVRKRRPAAR
jgi:CBS domain-containing protein